MVNIDRFKSVMIRNVATFCDNDDVFESLLAGGILRYTDLEARFGSWLRLFHNCGRRLRLCNLGNTCWRLLWLLFWHRFASFQEELGLEVHQFLI